MKVQAGFWNVPQLATATQDESGLTTVTHSKKTTLLIVQPDVCPAALTHGLLMFPVRLHGTPAHVQAAHTNPGAAAHVLQRPPRWACCAAFSGRQAGGAEDCRQADTPVTNTSAALRASTTEDLAIVVIL
jgi:hypothetical protein